MREARPVDKAAAIKLLSEAFENNKSVNYVVKHPKARSVLMNYAFKICLRWGKVYISEDKKAVALLLFPHLKKFSLHAIYLDLILAIKGIGLSKVFQVLKRESEIKKHHPQQPFVYFWFLGVDKNMQGQGLGSAMLNKIIAAHNDLPILLETSTVRNIPLYERFGFRTYKILNIGSPLHMMRYEAKL